MAHDHEAPVETSAAHAEGPAPTHHAPTSGLAAVQAIGGGGDAAAQVVHIVHAHPGERDAILRWLQQHRGNAFVQEVIARSGQVERALPGNVDVQSVRASITIPGKRKLAGGYWQGGTVQTKHPTEIGVEITHTGLRVFVSPGLYLDADWPLQDCELGEAGVDFARKQPFAHVTDVSGLGTGFVSISGRVSARIVDLLTKALGHTELMAGGYDPAQDPALEQTMHRVLAGFVALFDDHDGKDKQHAPAHAPIGPGDMTHLSAGATIAVRDGANLVKGGSGLTIAANGPVSFDVDTSANLHDALAVHRAQDAADHAHVQQVRLSTEALEVVVHGKPIARLEQRTVARGGKVTIDRMTPLGRVKDAEAGEAGLSLLATLVAIAGHDRSAGELYRNAQDPKLVDGITRAMIEAEFTKTLHQMILEWRGVVPGVDLAKVLGIG